MLDQLIHEQAFRWSPHHGWKPESQQAMAAAATATAAARATTTAKLATRVADSHLRIGFHWKGTLLLTLGAVFVLGIIYL